MDLFFEFRAIKNCVKLLFIRTELINSIQSFKKLKRKMKVPSILPVIICLVLLMAQCSGKGKLFTKSRTDLNDQNIIYQFRILEKKQK